MLASYAAPQARNSIFPRPRNSQNCLKFLDDPLIHDHIHDILGGAKRPPSEVLGEAMTGLVLPWIRQ